MPDYVRVSYRVDGATHHATVLRQEAETNAAAYTELKQPAVDHNGDPLPGEILPESTPHSDAPKK